MPVPDERKNVTEISAVSAARDDQQELPLVDLDSLSWPSICQAYLERTGRDISGDDQLRMIVDVNKEMFVALWDFLLDNSAGVLGHRLKKFAEESDQAIEHKKRELHDQVIITATILGERLRGISKDDIQKPLESQIKEFRELVNLLRDNEAAKKAKWIITGLLSAALILLVGVFCGMGMAWFFKPA